MTVKFTALLPFAYGEYVYNPTGQIYEHENEHLVKTWEHHNYCKIVELCTDSAPNEKEVETVENDGETSQNGSHDDLEKLSYKDLQVKAKAAGIKATGVKAKDLIAKLKEVE